MKVVWDKKQIMRWGLTLGSSFWLLFPSVGSVRADHQADTGKDIKITILPPKSGTLMGVDLKPLALSVAGTLLLINCQSWSKAAEIVFLGGFSWAPKGPALSTKGMSDGDANCSHFLWVSRELPIQQFLN